MITAEEIHKLASTCAPGNSVLSLYLPVPLNPADLHTLPTTLTGLLGAAEAAASAAPGLSAADQSAVRRLVDARAREWLGHTVAIFASGRLGLLEAVPLPGRTSARCVLTARPHVRPLLALQQRFPRYLTVVVSRQHAWIFTAAGDETVTVARIHAPAAPHSHGSSGWPGPDSYRARQRATEQARRH